jgi:hypothetical protein
MCPSMRIPPITVPDKIILQDAEQFCTFYFNLGCVTPGHSGIKSFEDNENL